MQEVMLEKAYEGNEKWKVTVASSTRN